MITTIKSELKTFDKSSRRLNPTSGHGIMDIITSQMTFIPCNHFPSQSHPPQRNSCLLVNSKAKKLKDKTMNFSER